jgi:hypothetical protein
MRIVKIYPKQYALPDKKSEFDHARKNARNPCSKRRSTVPGQSQGIKMSMACLPIEFIVDLLKEHALNMVLNEVMIVAE